MDKLRFLVETYIDYQKDHHRLDNRLRSLPQNQTGETFFKDLASDAYVLEENLTGKVKYIRVWMPAVMAVAENPSDLHKYCGVSPGSKRRRGAAIHYNPKVKTLMWKILRQVNMAKGQWAKIYKTDKADYEKRCLEPEIGTKKLKVHLTTKNIIMRKFLTNLWLVYRWMNSLPTTQPYPSILGHTITQPFIETPEGIIYLKETSIKPQLKPCQI